MRKCLSMCVCEAKLGSVHLRDVSRGKGAAEWWRKFVAASRKHARRENPGLLGAGQEHASEPRPVPALPHGVRQGGHHRGHDSQA